MYLLSRWQGEKRVYFKAGFYHETGLSYYQSKKYDMILAHHQTYFENKNVVLA